MVPQAAATATMTLEVSGNVGLGSRLSTPCVRTVTTEISDGTDERSPRLQKRRWASSLLPPSSFFLSLFLSFCNFSRVPRSAWMLDFYVRVVECREDSYRILWVAVSTSLKNWKNQLPPLLSYFSFYNRSHFCFLISKCREDSYRIFFFCFTFLFSPFFSNFLTANNNVFWKLSKQNSNF